MRKLTFIFISSLIPLGINAQNTDKTIKSDFQYFELHTITKGIYVAIGKDGATGCNTGIIDNGDYLTLFDPFFSIDPANELKAVLKKRFPKKKVRYIINSHWHDDHTKGNQYFKPEATIIGTQELRDNMLSRFNPNKDQIRESLNQDLKKYQIEKTETKNEIYRNEIQQYWIPGITAELKSLSSYQLTPPDLIFSDSILLKGKDFDINVISYGSGHTESDIVIWLPHAKVIFMGDLLFVQRHAGMGHGNYFDWLKYLDKIELKSPSIFIPAHGSIEGAESVRQLRKYLEFVFLTAKAIAESGQPIKLEDIAVPEIYSTYWWAYIFKYNVKHVYELIGESKK